MNGRPPARAGGSQRSRILIIVENCPAAEDHRVAKQIGSLVEAGYQVRVITQGSPENAVYRHDPRIRVFAYPSPPQPRGRLGYLVEYGYSVLAAALLSVGAAAPRRPDVVQFCEPPNIYFPLAWIFKRLGARVVVDQRDLHPELYAARYGSIQKPMLAVLRFLERRSFTGADGVLCVNDYLRERILAVSGVAGDRVAVARNGPVLARVSRATSDESLKRGHKYLCCWVGVMGLQDRVDLVLRSINHLVHALGRDDCEFAIIGSGEYLPAAQGLARELDLGNWVEFTGELDPDEVFRYLATADLGLDASLQIDVSPVKAMEYMAFGLPLVAFDLAETRVLTEGAAAYAKAGDVCGHACAINALLGDTERRRKLGQVGRARVWDEVAWDHQAVPYLRMIDQLCATLSMFTPVRRVSKKQALLVAVQMAGFAVFVLSGCSQPAAPAKSHRSAPPAPAGYFTLRPVGAWRSLPSDSQCAARVHYSTWEPRPANYQQNHTMPAPGAMAASFALRPRNRGHTYNPLWDSWLLPRVDGRFTGTTDEILQWAACKWGLPDNLIRADAAVESTWFQYLHFPGDASAGGGGGGSCYWKRGCGDAFQSPTASSIAYCNAIATEGLLPSEVHNYQKDPVTNAGGYPYTPRPGMCPRTFSILGVMSWVSPESGYSYPGDQNGTFPFTRDSTAAAADYWGASIRGCYEGWKTWLKNTGNHSYRAGGLWGCIGSWFSGQWHSRAANAYIAKVQWAEKHRIWLDPSFDDSKRQAHCTTAYGCPA